MMSVVIGQCNIEYVIVHVTDSIFHMIPITSIVKSSEIDLSTRGTLLSKQVVIRLWLKRNAELLW